jgi:hypothetical protein
VLRVKALIEKEVRHVAPGQPHVAVASSR